MTKTREIHLKYCMIIVGTAGEAITQFVNRQWQVYQRMKQQKHKRNKTNI